MNIKLDTGTIVTLAAVVFLYIRLYLITQKNKKLQKSQSKFRKKGEVQDVTTTALGYKIGNVWVGLVGLAILVVGFLAAATELIPAPYKNFWWVATSAGIVIISFAFK